LGACHFATLGKARLDLSKDQCRNHLKQIGLAFPNHHTQFKFFPTGGWNDGVPTYVNGQPVVGLEQQAVKKRRQNGIRNLNEVRTESGTLMSLIKGSCHLSSPAPIS
jgi:Protein of unknown function (DUF1559)